MPAGRRPTGYLRNLLVERRRHPAPAAAELTPSTPDQADSAGGRPRLPPLDNGSPAERCSHALIWWVSMLALAAGQAWHDIPPVVAAASAAAPALGVYAGYCWSPGLHRRRVLTLLWRRLGRPYLVWTALVGIPVVIWEGVTDSVAIGNARAETLLRGGRDFTAPLIGHWLAVALLVAVFAVCLIQPLVRVEIAWLIPASLTLTYLTSTLAVLPVGVGLGLAMVSFLLMGQALRLCREYVGRRTGAVLLVGGLAVLCLPTGPWGSLGPVDLQAGNPGAPVFAACAAGIVGIGLVIVAEQISLILPRRLRRAVSASGRFVLVGLFTCGLGVFLSPPSWPRGLALLASVGVVLFAALLVRTRREPSWLLGEVRTTGCAAGERTLAGFPV